MPEPSSPGSILIQGLDRLASRVVSALHSLFGFQYSRNQEHYVFQVTQIGGTADAIGTVFNTAINITQEADFVCTRLNCNARISTSGTSTLVGAMVGASVNSAAAGDWPDAPFTLLITAGSTDRQISNQPVDAALVYGTQGGLPGVFARPRLFARNTTVSLQITSLKTVPASTVWTYRIAMIGWKIYDASALDNTSRGLAA